MGQMFYSLHRNGILVTFGSYMKKDVPSRSPPENVEIFDTAIAIMAGLMIIPAVFSFRAATRTLCRPARPLMFITIPKVFESMGLGTVVGILFLHAGAFRRRHQLYRPDGKRCLHLRGRAGLGA